MDVQLPLWAMELYTLAAVNLSSEKKKISSKWNLMFNFCPVCAQFIFKTAAFSPCEIWMF